MTDLKAQYRSIKKDVNFAARQVLNGCAFVLGKQVAVFEEAVSRYQGVKYAVGVASGTDALALALCACGIKDGDEVITTPFTFIATAEAIFRAGAKPVFCDIKEDYNIDADKIESRITPKTKAILPVHLYGLPCDMDKIMALAAKYRLKVIEDCAQSFGSEYKSRKTGAIGSCGALSFFPSKNLGCYGDGGMVVTNNKDIREKLVMLRNHGSDSKYHYSMHGFNSRLDTLQAAILNVKIKHIDKWVYRRIVNAGLYNRLLGLSRNIVTPEIPKGVKHSFNYYTIRLKEGRAAVQERLKKRKIPWAVYYPLCLHLQPVYKKLNYKRGDFPVAEQMQEEVLSLPMYPELKAVQIKHIAKAVLN